MSYIGNKPATSFETVQKQISTSNSGTTITLDRAVTSVQDILLTIDAVVQSYDNYSVSGTTLTVGGTLSNNRVEILYVGRTMQSVDPTDDSVSAAKIKTDAVTTAKVQNDAITVDKLNLISTSSVPSLEAKGDGSSVAGKIIWNCENNSHGQTIQAAPHSSGQSWTLKLPDNSPTADKFLKVKSITGSGSTATGQLEFAEAGGGSWNLIETETLTSGASVDINGFSSSYGVHAITWENVRSVVDNDVIKMMLLDSGGNNYQIYYGNVKTNLSETGGINGPTGNGTYSTSPHTVNLFGSVGSGSNEGVSGNMYLTGLPDSNDAVLFWGNFTVFRHDNIYENYAIWGRGANLVVDKVRFFFNGGNFEHGTMKLYGLS